MANAEPEMATAAPDTAKTKSVKPSTEKRHTAKQERKRMLKPWHGIGKLVN